MAIMFYQLFTILAPARSRFSQKYKNGIENQNRDYARVRLLNLLKTIKT